MCLQSKVSCGICERAEVSKGWGEGRSYGREVKEVFPLLVAALHIVVFPVREPNYFLCIHFLFLCLGTKPTNVPQSLLIHKSIFLKKPTLMPRDTCKQLPTSSLLAFKRTRALSTAGWLFLVGHCLSLSIYAKGTQGSQHSCSPSWAVSSAHLLPRGGGESESQDQLVRISSRQHVTGCSTTSSFMVLQIKSQQVSS